MGTASGFAILLSPARIPPGADEKSRKNPGTARRPGGSRPRGPRPLLHRLLPVLQRPALLRGPRRPGAPLAPDARREPCLLQRAHPARRRLRPPAKAIPAAGSPEGWPPHPPRRPPFRDRRRAISPPSAPCTCTWMWTWPGGFAPAPPPRSCGRISASTPGRPRMRRIWSCNHDRASSSSSPCCSPPSPTPINSARNCSSP